MIIYMEGSLVIDSSLNCGYKAMISSIMEAFL